MKSLEVSVFSEHHEFGPDGRLEFPMFGSAYVLERLSDTTLRFSKREGERIVDSEIVSVNLSGARFTFDPRLLELPVVLRFSAGVVVHPKTSMRIYALLPVDVSLILTASGNRIPIRNLAEGDILKTCYGPVDTGEVCYISYSDVFWSEKELPDITSFFAVLPIRIENPSARSFNVGRVLVEPWMLDLYASDGRLFAAAVRLTLRGRGAARLTYLSDPPHPDDPKIEAARSAPKRGLLERLLPGGRTRKLAYFED